jgi:hypothetical protein
LGVNAPSGFAGNLLDLQVNGGRAFTVSQVSTSTQLNLYRPDANNPGAFISSSNSELSLGRDAAGTKTNFISCIISGSTPIVTIGSGSLTPLLMASSAAISKTNFTVAGGDPVSNRAVDGHDLILRGGNGSGASGTDRNGGDVYIIGGNSKGSGVNGKIRIGESVTSGIGFFGATPAAQPTAVADATTSVDVITQFNALLARMRALGLIAT